MHVYMDNPVLDILKEIHLSIWPQKLNLIFKWIPIQKTKMSFEIKQYMNLVRKASLEGKLVTSKGIVSVWETKVIPYIFLVRYI